MYVVKSSNLGLGWELLIFSIPSRTSRSLWFRSYQELVEHSQEIHEATLVNEQGDTGKLQCPLPLCSSTFSKRGGMLYSLDAALLGYFQSIHGTRYRICLRSCCFGLETRIIIKISTHPCYPVDSLLWPFLI